MTALTTVTYHYVRPIAGSRFPGLKGLEVARFEEQLLYLLRNYEPVSARQVVDAARGGQSLPSRPVLLTFDDGYLDHYSYVFPLLVKHGITGVFFPPTCALFERQVLDVNKVHFVLERMPDRPALISELERQIDAARGGYALPGFDEYRAKYMRPFRWDDAETIYVKRMLQHALPDRLRGKIAAELFRRFVTADEAAFADELYLNAAQLRDMTQAGMEVGSHGHNHLWLDREEPAVQEADICRSLGYLSRVGAPERGFLFCYPYGAYNGDTLALLSRLGCAAAFTTRSGLVDVVPASLLEIPRIDTNDVPASGAKAGKRSDEPVLSKRQVS